VTPRQERALRDLWSAYGVQPGPEPLDARRLFGRRAPLVLEIGFGMGEATVAMAAADPGRDVLAVDVHTPGAGALLAAVAEQGLGNVRVLVGDAVPVLAQRLAAGSLAELRAFFPDPWPKTRHEKRRLVGPRFLRLAGRSLATGGRLHCATDWAPYARQMLAGVADEPTLTNPYDGFAPRPPERPVTRFERQGLAKGHAIYDVVALRCVDSRDRRQRPVS
jgi:tRNA (guanine-N7-)-methyltransferase